MTTKKWSIEGGKDGCGWSWNCDAAKVLGKIVGERVEGAEEEETPILMIGIEGERELKSGP